MPRKQDTMPDTKKDFPSFDKWEAPWEKRGDEFDAEQAKKLVYNLKRDIHNLETTHSAKVEELTGQIATLTTERDEKAAKVTELEDAKITDEAERARVQQQRTIEELSAKLDKVLNGETAPAAGKEKEGEAAVTETDKLRLALKYGLSEKDAARLIGSTKEELEQDARSYAEERGAIFDDDGDGFGYDDGSSHGEMPRSVPAVPGHRSNLGGNLGHRSFDPAKERDALPRR